MRVLALFSAVFALLASPLAAQSTKVIDPSTGQPVFSTANPAPVKVVSGGTGTSAAQVQGTAATGAAPVGNPLFVGFRDSSGNLLAPEVNSGSLNGTSIGTAHYSLDVNSFMHSYDTLNSQWALIKDITNSTDSNGSGFLASGLMGQRDDTSPSSITENNFANVRIGSGHQLLNMELGHYPYSAILGTPATPIRGASGNVAAANAVATLTGTATTTVYMTGFTCTPGGATAAVLVDIAITGTLGGTLTYTAGAPAGATLMGTPISATFYPAYPASAVNTPIVVTMPSLGTGNAHAACVATGYYM